MQQRAKRSFTGGSKADAVSMVAEEERSIFDVADGLGVGESTLGNWVRQARTDRGDRRGLTRDEKVGLAQLRRDNARLRMARDPLKGATVLGVLEVGGNSASSL